MEHSAMGFVAFILLMALVFVAMKIFGPAF
jgi:hypothetical protein